MRLVQILVPEGARESIVASLDDEGVDYAMWEETGRGDFEAVISFPVPTGGVEPVLSRLRDEGLEENAYTIVQSTETVVSRRMDDLRERYTDLRISREELVARAAELAPEASTFFIFLVVSTLIATAGLLLDSTATIIGAMVIAPLMGPAISASVGTVLAKDDMASRGLALQVTGLAAAVATGALFGLLLKETVLLPPVDIRTIPQVAERTSPNFLSLFLALGSGIAGAVSLIRGAGSALVGVAIAVALIPPAATAGLGLAWGYPGVTVAAGVLVLVNLLAVNLSALVLFWLAGYRPEIGTYAARTRRRVRAHVAAVVVGIALLSVVLGLVTVASFEVGTVEYTTNGEVEAMFDEGRFDGLQFESTSVDYTITDVLFGEPATVAVVAEHGPDARIPPGVAQDIDDRLTNETGEPVTVDVEFVRGQRSAV